MVAAQSRSLASRRILRQTSISSRLIRSRFANIQRRGEIRAFTRSSRCSTPSIVRRRSDQAPTTRAPSAIGLAQQPTAAPSWTFVPAPGATLQAMPAEAIGEPSAPAAATAPTATPPADGLPGRQRHPVAMSVIEDYDFAAGAAALVAVLPEMEGTAHEWMELRVIRHLNSDRAVAGRLHGVPGGVTLLNRARRRQELARPCPSRSRRRVGCGGERPAATGPDQGDLRQGRDLALPGRPDASGLQDVAIRPRQGADRLPDLPEEVPETGRLCACRSSRMMRLDFLIARRAHRPQPVEAAFAPTRLDDGPPSRVRPARPAAFPRRRPRQDGLVRERTTPSA